MTEAQRDKHVEDFRNGVKSGYQDDYYNFRVYQEHEGRYVSHGGEKWPEWDAPNNDPNDWWES